MQSSSGELSVSVANKITSVITPENKDQWLKQAKELPRILLEKEVAKTNPKAATPERATYVTDNRMALKLGVSEELFKKLKRIQDLESKRLRKSVSIEDVLEILVPNYLEKHDPVIKAQRAVKRAKDTPPSTIPEQTISKIFRRHVPNVTDLSMRAKVLNRITTHSKTPRGSKTDRQFVRWRHEFIV